MIEERAKTIDLCMTAYSHFDEEVIIRRYWDGAELKSITRRIYDIIPYAEGISVVDTGTGEIIASVCE
jgi:hypothetical protein